MGAPREVIRAGLSRCFIPKTRSDANDVCEIGMRVFSNNVVRVRIGIRHSYPRRLLVVYVALCAHCSRIWGVFRRVRNVAKIDG